MYALRVKEHADLTRALAGNQAEIARIGAQLSQVTVHIKQMQHGLNTVIDACPLWTESP